MKLAHHKIFSLLSVAILSGPMLPVANALTAQGAMRGEYGQPGLMSLAIGADTKSSKLESLEKQQSKNTAKIDELETMISSGEYESPTYPTDQGSAHFKCQKACTSEPDKEVILEGTDLTDIKQIKPLCQHIFDNGLMGSVSQGCKTAVLQYGPAKAKEELASLKRTQKKLAEQAEREQAISDKAANARSEKQRSDFLLAAACPACAMANREPSAGEIAIGLASALAPIGMGAINLGMYGMGLNSYNNNFTNYMAHQQREGAPVQPPGFWGGNAWGGAVPWGGGGFGGGGFGGGGFNPLASLMNGGMGFNLSLGMGGMGGGLGGGGGFNPMFGNFGMNPMIMGNGFGNPMFGNPMFGNSMFGNPMGGFNGGLSFQAGIGGGMGNPFGGMGGFNGGLGGFGNPFGGMGGFNGGLGGFGNPFGGMGGFNGGLGGFNGGLGGFNGGLGGFNGGLGGFNGGLGGMDSSIFLQQQQQQAAMMAQYQAQQQALMQEQMLRLQKQQEAQKSIMLAQQQYGEALSRLQQTMQGAASIQATGGISFR